MRLVILDLDGTVYRGEEACPYAVKAINHMVEKGLLVRYFTNNSAAEPVAIAAKLKRLGIPCEPSWVYGTGPAAARYCAEQNWSRAFIVGSPTLAEFAVKEGLEVVESDADVVIAGICRTLTYDLLMRAQQEILRGAHFVATNLDPTYPKESGRFEPGAGAIIAALHTCTGREPLVIGKPEPTIIYEILADTGISPEDAIVVGDREDTDLESGRRAGVATWLVLTGVTALPIPGQSGSPDLRGLLQ